MWVESNILEKFANICESCRTPSLLTFVIFSLVYCTTIQLFKKAR
jgi:hypothetical protein